MNLVTIASSVILFLSLVKDIAAFAVLPSKCVQPRSTCLNAIEVMNVADLDDHEAEGTRLSKSVAGWLDREWMTQEVHVQMGEVCKQTYIRCRENGEAEIMSIMTEITDDLYADWKKFDKDAFVNAWDIGNYVSDYLHERVGAESCGCNAVIFNPDEV